MGDNPSSDDWWPFCSDELDPEFLNTVDPIVAPVQQTDGDDDDDGFDHEYTSFDPDMLDALDPQTAESGSGAADDVDADAAPSPLPVLAVADAGVANGVSQPLDVADAGVANGVSQPLDVPLSLFFENYSFYLHGNLKLPARVRDIIRTAGGVLVECKAANYIICRETTSIAVFLADKGKTKITRQAAWVHEEWIHACQTAGRKLSAAPWSLQRSIAGRLGAVLTPPAYERTAYASLSSATEPLGRVE